MLGTRLRDPAGAPLWGFTRNLYVGRSLRGAASVQLDGTLDHFTLLPGLAAVDVHGGLIRYLTAVGGYTFGEDLHVLQYDWRQGVAHGAKALAALIEQLRGIGDEQVDLVCVSSGGLLARYYLAYGATPLSEAGAPSSNDTVRRVVYVATPHRGSLQALNVLQNGFQLAPLGRTHSAVEAVACQITYDLLPHPDEPVATDVAGNDVPLDLHQADSWRRFGLSTVAMPELDARLTQATALHRALDRATARHDAIVIATRNVMTPARLLVRAGKASWPDCCDGPYAARAPWFLPGDGSVCERSATAVSKALDGAPTWHVKARVHHDVVSRPDTHRLVLEGLLATDRTILPMPWQAPITLGVGPREHRAP